MQNVVFKYRAFCLKSLLFPIAGKARSIHIRTQTIYIRGVCGRVEPLNIDYFLLTSVIKLSDSKMWQHLMVNKQAFRRNADLYTLNLHEITLL